ncbi:MAG: hypothetical protein K2P12_03690 [Clostridia bacterium]|nr:hypothetical protein [Clostridia bacterium]
MKEILEPLKEYNRYQEQFDGLVEKTFNKLLKESKVDVKKNSETVKQFNDVDEALKKERKKLKGKRTLRKVLIFLTIISAIATVIGGFILYGSIKIQISLLTGILITVISPVIMIGCMLLIFLYCNKVIKSLRESVTALRENAQSVLDEAWRQMAPLNKLFTNDITTDLINSLDMIIHLDKYYSVLHEVYLHKYYKFPLYSDDNSTTTSMVVGRIADNPFIITREMETEMGMKEYVGSLVVTWTESSRDSKGNRTTVTRSQTLTASVEKPCPEYEEETFLIYGNEAAPDLHFSRTPQVRKKGEKNIERMVKRGEKKLAKLAEQDRKSGDGSFTAMSDTEFDVLFGAFDRDNENQFRLLFTPLAQRNMVEFLKESPYGDDFSFYKQGKINTLFAYHGDSWDLTSGRDMESYSVEYLREMFTEYNCNFFKHMFFMLMPILNIPIYQQLKPNDMNIDLSSETNIAARQAEMIVNMFNKAFIAEAETATYVITKVKYMPSIGHVDNIMIYGYSYSIKSRVDYVSKWAGDGRMHSVPVYWDEYIPLLKTTEALIFDIKDLSSAGRSELMELLYENEISREVSVGGNGSGRAIVEDCGVMAVIPKGGMAQDLAVKINSIIKGN